MILADAQGKEQRFTKETVEERKVAPLSPMPADFAEKIPEAEFSDLMAYLLSTKGDLNFPVRPRVGSDKALSLHFDPVGRAVRPAYGRPASPGGNWRRLASWWRSGDLRPR